MGEIDQEHKDWYDDAHNPCWKIVDVPLFVATEENFKEYGRFVHDFEKEEVWITPWPTKKRKLYPGTGIQGGVRTGKNIHRWEGDLIVNINKAVDYGRFVYGRLPPSVSTNNRTHVLTREANFHPDGGQVFFPTDGKAFVCLLALPTEDVKPEDFVAFYLDGSCGVQIKAGVWHQPTYPVEDSSDFDGKQGAVFACVCVDTVEEFNTYLRVPLKPELAMPCHKGK